MNQLEVRQRREVRVKIAPDWRAWVDSRTRCHGWGATWPARNRRNIRWKLTLAPCWCQHESVGIGCVADVEMGGRGTSCDDTLSVQTGHWGRGGCRVFFRWKSYLASFGNLRVKRAKFGGWFGILRVKQAKYAWSKHAVFHVESSKDAKQRKNAQVKRSNTPLGVVDEPNVIRMYDCRGAASLSRRRGFPELHRALGLIDRQIVVPGNNNVRDFDGFEE